MDLSLIKKQLEESQAKKTKSQKFEKVDYSKIFWKPTVGKHQIRIVPSKFDPKNPFREVQLHYNFAKFPILALTNWKEQDPIVEFAKGLRKSSDKNDWNLAKKIEPKTRYFAPVIVRGEEDKGVRLWEFGVKIWTQLLGIANDEDYGDYTDITNGRDFTIEGTSAESFGKTIVECTIRPKPKSTAITEDPTLLQKFLSEQPDILTVNRKFTFDQLKEVLQKWLSPEDENEEENTINSHIESEDDFLKELEKPVTHYSENNDKAKVSKLDKFDALFDDDSN